MRARSTAQLLNACIATQKYSQQLLQQAEGASYLSPRATQQSATHVAPLRDSSWLAATSCTPHGRLCRAFRAAVQQEGAVIQKSAGAVDHMSGKQQWPIQRRYSQDLRVQHSEMSDAEREYRRKNAELDAELYEAAGGDAEAKKILDEVNILSEELFQLELADEPKRLQEKSKVGIADDETVAAGAEVPAQQLQIRSKLALKLAEFVLLLNLPKLGTDNQAEMLQRTDHEPAAATDIRRQSRRRRRAAKGSSQQQH